MVETGITNKMIETGYYKIEASSYVRKRIFTWAGRWWWALALPIAAFSVLGISDIRFIIAGLALLLVAYPGVMMLIYFNHALSAEVAVAVVPHKVKITAEGLTIEYEPQEDRRTPSPRTVSVEEIEEVEDTGMSILVHLRGRRYDFIEIPLSAFRGTGAADALRLIESKSILA